MVGESGCGKSTFARAIIGLVKATDGKVAWLGKDLLGMKPDEWREVRSDIQMIFQDPLASLNPRMTIGEIIAEPLRTYHPNLPGQEVRDRVKAMMMKVGLLPNLINRYPHEFSGGQCQRIGIARALILEPKLIICDEPVSALDVSIHTFFFRNGEKQTVVFDNASVKESRCGPHRGLRSPAGSCRAGGP